MWWLAFKNVPNVHYRFHVKYVNKVKTLEKLTLGARCNFQERINPNIYPSGMVNFPKSRIIIQKSKVSKFRILLQLSEKKSI